MNPNQKKILVLLSERRLMLGLMEMFHPDVLELLDLGFITAPGQEAEITEAGRQALLGAQDTV